MCPALRIVSLLPSTTEIACALGFGEALVGRSHECDHPEFVEALPILTEPKLDAGAPSATIDDRVKQLVRDGLSVYRVDAERLRQLEPDVILTQDQCEVCAASLQDVEEALHDWTGRRPRVVSLDPRRLDDVWRDVARVADSLGAPERAGPLVRALSQRVRAVAERCAAAETRPTVACIEWTDPLMAAGNWVPELVEIAGGTGLFGAAGAHAPWLAWPDLCAADPDRIVAMPCGFDRARTRIEMGPLVTRPEWRELRAVRNGSVAIVDGHRYFNRPGPRLADSAEILAEILQPGLFEPRHRGTAWEPW